MLYLYLAAKFSNTDIGFGELIKLKFRGIDTALFCRSMIILKKGGINISKTEIISRIKDKLDVMNIVKSLLLSKKNNIDFTLDEAIRGDKMGIDFSKVFVDVENIREKFKEIRNKIFINT